MHAQANHCLHILATITTIMGCDPPSSLERDSLTLRQQASQTMGTEALARLDACDAAGGALFIDHPTLTTETTRLLSSHPGTCLYLTGLSSLDLETAATLARWNGTMLSLDGLTTLDPTAAATLLAWPGEHLSLNGLTAVDVQTLSSLGQWRGRQLSLHQLDSQRMLDVIQKHSVSVREKAIVEMSINEQSLLAACESESDALFVDLPA
ncbi:MAG: hypothetical protein AAFV53_35830, partial [Myxococcota bacterium]